MKKVMLLSALLLLCGGSYVSKAADGAAVAVNAETSSFNLSIGNYFSANQKEIVALRDRGIKEEEIPVVYFLARKAKVKASRIADLRLGGKSWIQIANRYKYGADMFYVPIKDNEAGGPPYGHAYGYYKDNPRKEWKKMAMEDEDVVNMANLKFISGHYGYPAASIIKMRQNEKGFSAISDDIERQKKVNKEHRAAAEKKKNAGVAASADDEKPDHLTGTKKQVDKIKKFYKKKNAKAKKYINDKG